MSPNFFLTLSKESPSGSQDELSRKKLLTLCNVSSRGDTCLVTYKSATSVLYIFTVINYSNLSNNILVLIFGIILNPGMNIQFHLLFSKICI